MERRIAHDVMRFCSTALFVTMSLLGAAVFAAVPITEDGPTNLSGDWESYNKSLDGWRYSSLKHINKNNATGLIEACRVEIARGGAFESGPIVIGGSIYLTTAADTISLSATTCATQWQHRYIPRTASPVPTNRGVAFYSGRVFRGTADGHLIALDAETGKLLWDDEVAGDRSGAVISGAPLAWNGLVIVGTSSADLGLRGRIIAFDALSGREVWRFNTIPIGDEIGADSWANKNWAAHGGGGSWSHFAIDPETNELFAPVGNPVPDFSPEDRPGEDLFTNSVVVLDATRGTLKWWYQITPNDGFDYDLGAAPVLYPTLVGSPMVAAAGKDGYLHLIDRSTHTRVVKTAVTTVEPRPAAPTHDGAYSCPGPTGGVAWSGPAFDPVQHRLFVGAIDYCAVFISTPGTHWKSGQVGFGGSFRPAATPATGWITAVDAESGSVLWRYHTPSAMLGGITATAAGLLLAGDNAGNFYVFDSVNGKLLTKRNLNGSIAGGIVTYEQDGRQYIAVTAGNVSRTTFGVTGRPSLVILTVDQQHAPQSEHSDGGGAVYEGQGLYMTHCSVCHGAEGTTIIGKDLRTISKRMNAKQIENWIENPAPDMPKVFPDPPDHDEQAQIAAIAHYLYLGIQASK